MGDLTRCVSCHGRFVNNPKKHQDRAKFCPYCGMPYTKTGIAWKIPTISFRGIKEDLQKLFNFFPSRQKNKEVYYVCPNSECKYTTDFPEGLRFAQLPDKTKEVTLQGKTQTVILTYRKVPACPKCHSYMTRRSKKLKRP